MSFIALCRVRIGLDEAHKCCFGTNEKMRLYQVHLRLMMKLLRVPVCGECVCVCVFCTFHSQMNAHASHLRVNALNMVAVRRV